MMLNNLRLLLVAAMLWMMCGVNAQSLLQRVADRDLASSGIYGDLNGDDEVSISDLNIIVDLIIKGTNGPVPGPIPNMTIAEFKAKHWNDATNYVDTVTENEVIHGWVTSSDQSGNIYKTLYIMDESGAGLSILINNNKLNDSYAIGQEIVLSMKDYWVGKYNGQQSIGYPYWYANGSTWEVSFLPQEMWNDMVQLKGNPNEDMVKPVELDLNEIDGKTDAETLLKYQGLLVRVSDVTFDDADGVNTYSEANRSTNRTVTDENGHQLVVRTSNYADFSGEVLPQGKATLVGELTFYRTRSDNPGSWQLYLRDINDVTADEQSEPEPETYIMLNESFENNLPVDWSNVIVSGDKKWYHTSYQNNGYAAVTGYKGTQPPFDTWFITPALDIKEAESQILSFRTEVNGYGSTTSKFEVYLLNASDPTAATLKVNLNPTLAVAPDSGYSGWVESGDIDLSQWADGNVYYIGFRFQADPDSNYATWCLDDVKFGL